MLATVFTTTTHKFETDPKPRTPWNAQPHKRLAVKLKMRTTKDGLFKRNYSSSNSNHKANIPKKQPNQLIKDKGTQ